MALDPVKLNLHRGVDFIPVTAFTGIGPMWLSKGAIVASTEIGILDDSADNIIGNNAISAAQMLLGPASMGSGNPYLAEIGTIGLVGLRTNTDGDDVHHLMRIPLHWDHKYPVYVRVVWATASTTNSDTVTWKVLFNLLEPTTTLLNRLIAPATALDTAIPQDTVVGGFGPQVMVTENGVINADTLTPDVPAKPYQYIQLLVEMDAKEEELTEDLFLVGLEFEYTPRLGLYHRRQEANAWRR